MTTTFASSVTVSPVAPTRHVTERASGRPLPSTVPMRVANASAISVAFLPPRAQRWAVSAIGT